MKLAEQLVRRFKVYYPGFRRRSEKTFGQNGINQRWGRIPGELSGTNINGAKPEFGTAGKSNCRR